MADESEEAADDRDGGDNTAGWQIQWFFIKHDNIIITYCALPLVILVCVALPRHDGINKLTTSYNHLDPAVAIMVTEIQIG